MKHLAPTALSKNANEILVIGSPFKILHTFFMYIQTHVSLLFNVLSLYFLFRQTEPFRAQTMILWCKEAFFKAKNKMVYIFSSEFRFEIADFFH